jgi:hypothetical protein
LLTIDTVSLVVWFQGAYKADIVKHGGKVANAVKEGMQLYLVEMFWHYCLPMDYSGGKFWFHFPKPLN